MGKQQQKRSIESGSLANIEASEEEVMKPDDNHKTSFSMSSDTYLLEKARKLLRGNSRESSQTCSINSPLRINNQLALISNSSPNSSIQTQHGTKSEVDCEYLKRCCETLSEENIRLQNELQELRACRTKLKETDEYCEYLRRCCETLTEENTRLQKELQEFRAFKSSQPFYMQIPPTTLTMCPSCERVATTTTTNNTPPAAATAAGTSQNRNTSALKLFGASCK
ncbi:hypothetical protein ACH5RR_007473 [Cinchona calisaya]|uniref:Leucine zipper homeobox-associated domain-containing protein n=1 Tax=Cinchona calisaya TaxID=153742 RepID=A0ABD3ASE6_9GENT